MGEDETGRLDVMWLGRVPYTRALALQNETLEARSRGEIGDRLLLLEHPPVVTLGRSAHASNLLWTREELAGRGIEVHEVARGGDVTYHAPGQLVGYLICDLAARGRPDVHAFLRQIEAILIGALGRLGVPARRLKGRTGVFIDSEELAQCGGRAAGARPRKIASIGVGLRHWVSYHGFALNVSTELAGFDAIVPCGLRDVEMTSVVRELGAGPLGLDERVREIVMERFRSAEIGCGPR